MSDRGEYKDNATSGHVTGYDTDAPGWGQTAEGAWGGIGESNGQGILTRPFISGGWTWTVSLLRCRCTAALHYCAASCGSAANSRKRKPSSPSPLARLTPPLF